MRAHTHAQHNGTKLNLKRPKSIPTAHRQQQTVLTKSFAARYQIDQVPAPAKLSPFSDIRTVKAQVRLFVVFATEAVVAHSTCFASSRRPNRYFRAASSFIRTISQRGQNQIEPLGRTAVGCSALAHALTASAPTIVCICEEYTLRSR